MKPQIDLMLIGCGVMAEPYLLSATERKLSVAVVEVPARLAVLTAQYGCITATEEIDPAYATTDEGWITPSLALASRVNPRGVVAFSESNVIAGAVVQRKLASKGPGLFAATLSRNKAMQRRLLVQDGRHHPGNILASPLASGSQWALAHLPVVIKPLSGTGSAGVEEISTPAEWEDALSRRGHQPLLVEQFITSQEYSWEALVQGGRVVCSNVTRKTTTGPPNFVEILHEMAFESTSGSLQAVSEDFGRRVVADLSMEDGIICVEFRFDGETDPILMEAMVRMPGDFIVNAVSLAQGEDWFGHVISIALDEALDLHGSATSAAAVLYGVAERTGTLVASRTQELTSIAGVHAVRDRFSLGTSVRPAESSSDRLTSVIFSASSRIQLDEAIRAVQTAMPRLVDIITR